MMPSRPLLIRAAAGRRLWPRSRARRRAAVRWRGTEQHDLPAASRRPTTCRTSPVTWWTRPTRAHLRVRGNVEEVGRAQVLVAGRMPGVEAVGVDRELDRRAVGRSYEPANRSTGRERSSGPRTSCGELDGRLVCCRRSSASTRSCVFDLYCGHLNSFRGCATNAGRRRCQTPCQTRPPLPARPARPGLGRCKSGAGERAPAPWEARSRRSTVTRGLRSRLRPPGRRERLLRLPLEQLLAADRDDELGDSGDERERCDQCEHGERPAPGFREVTIPKTIDAGRWGPSTPCRFRPAGEPEGREDGEDPQRDGVRADDVQSASADAGPGEDQHADCDPEHAAEDQPPALLLALRGERVPSSTMPVASV